MTRHRIEGTSNGYEGAFTLILTPLCQNINNVPRLLPGLSIKDDDKVIVVKKGRAISMVGRLEFFVGQKEFSFEQRAVRRLLDRNNEVLWQNRDFQD